MFPTQTSTKWKPIGRSELARELAALPPSRRRLVPDEVLALVDLFVTACSAAIDDSDARPLLERVPEAIEPLVEAFDWGRLEDSLTRAGSPEQAEAMLPRWLRRIDKPGFRAFLRRLLGAASFERVERAFKADAALCLVALRRALRFSLLYGAAIDECLRLLSAEQRSLIPGMEALQKATVTDVLVGLDKKLEATADSNGLPLDDVPLRSDELRELEGDTEELLAELRQRVSDEALRYADELSATVARKLRGARHALENSPDAVSQAATSLIELIDRTLRAAFSDEEALAWVAEHAPERDGMTYTKQDSSDPRPTRRARALCFSYAGGPVLENAMLHEAAALAIVQLPQALEGMKHADNGTDEERAELLDFVSSVESYFLLVCRVGWTMCDESDLARVKSRLAA